MPFTHKLYDIEPRRAVREQDLGFCAGLTDGEASVMGNREFSDLSELSWTDYSRVLASEKELVERLESTDDEDGELEKIEDEMLEDPELLFGLDIGLAAAVVGLSALGCTTFASCNAGAYGGSHHEDYPLIVFWAPIALVPHLLDLAEITDVGLENADDGMLMVYANDIRRIAHFSEKLEILRSANVS